MNRRTQRHSGGFTLVETLAAGIILALSAAVLGLSVRQGMRSLAMARDYQQAAELLDETLTKIDLIGPARVLAYGPADGAFAPPNQRFRWSAAIDTSLNQSLYDVAVRISWRTPAGESHSLVAQTFLYDPPDETLSQLAWEDL